MAFGIKRVVLAAAQYGLDEDGWIDIRTRLTVGNVMDAAQAAGSNGDQKTSMKHMLIAYIAGWHIKADGEELAYKPEAVLDLPANILPAAQEVIGSVPLVQSIIVMPSPAELSSSAPETNSG